jgi:signal transduction histidine kinase
MRAAAPERQQLLLLMAAAALVLGCIASGQSSVVMAAVLSLPAAAVSVGILRYHVGGITPVLRALLFYLVLAVMVGAVMVAVFAAMKPLRVDRAVVFLSAALVVSVLVVPFSAWLRRQVDRLLLGPTADPLIALDRVARTERPDRGHDPLQSVLLGMVEEIGVRYAAVLDVAGRTLASTGEPDEEASAVERVALRSGRDDLGYLVLSSLKDLGGRRLVAALTVHIAAVMRAQQLATEIQAERAHVVEAAMAERERVRQDLHDGLGPSLSGISLSLQAADTVLAKDPEAARALLRRACDEADLAGAEVRRVIDRLRPAALDGSDLGTALGSAARGLGFEGAGAPTLHLVCRLERALPARTEDTAYRIAHEALHNVVRHAQAKECTLTIADLGSSLEVTVVDDGKGIDDVAHTGLGLGSMHLRAASVGGTLQVTSPVDEGGGTCVRLALPLTEERQ